MPQEQISFGTSILLHMYTKRFLFEIASLAFTIYWKFSYVQ